MPSSSFAASAQQHSLLALVFVPLLLLSIARLGHATDCPSADPYSDTPQCLARQKCQAPEVICCPASGQCSSTTTTTSSSSSSSTSTPSTSSVPSATDASSSSSYPCVTGYSSSSSSSVAAQEETSSASTESSVESSSSSVTSNASSDSTSSSSSSSAASDATSESTSESTESTSSSSSSASSSSSYAPCYEASSSSAANYSDASSSSDTASSTSSAASTTTGVGSNEPCPCQLIIALLEFMYAQLNSSEQAIFESDCLARLRVILVDVSLSVEQKIVQCGYVIRSFCSAHSSIGDKLKWVQIGDFGYCYNFAFVVAIAYEDELADSVCEQIDDAGASDFSVAISNGTSQDQCGSGSASVWAGLVSKLNQVIRRTIAPLVKSRKLAYIYDSLEHIYFADYPSQESCVRNITISSDNYTASVGQFLDLCGWYDKLTSVVNSQLVDDSSTGECPFISSLDDGVTAANSSGQYNASVVEEAEEFVAACREQFAAASSAYGRLQIVLAIFPALSLECRLLLKQIQIVGGNAECSCADVIAIGNSCQNGYACQNVSLGGPGESFEETCLIDTYNVSSVVQASANWLNNRLNTTAQKTAYRSFHNSIVNCCYAASYGSNVTARFECVRRYVSSYSSNNSALRALYLSVELSTTIVVKVVSNVISAFYGTLGCFCGCTSC